MSETWFTSLTPPDEVQQVKLSLNKAVAELVQVVQNVTGRLITDLNRKAMVEWEGTLREYIEEFKEYERACNDETSEEEDEEQGEE